MKKPTQKSTKLLGENFTIDRRAFNRGLFSAGLSALMWPIIGGGDESDGGDRAAKKPKLRMVDYIVVGSGAGGGPVAARLAAAGYTVAVIEAGHDPAGQKAETLNPPGAFPPGAIYPIPAFAAVTAEHPLLSWDFFCKHYSDPAQQAKDPKLVPGKGILYSRGSCLGGSTAHNAMLWVYPHDKDWDDISALTGDTSWRATNMRKYFQRLEKCEYCAPNAPGHGFAGYINSSVFSDQIFSLAPAIKDLAEAGQTNPAIETNDLSIAAGGTGTVKAAMHVSNIPRNVRVSIREHLLNTRSNYPNKLFLLTGALASKIITRGRRAIGVEFMRAPNQNVNLYEADKLYDPGVTPETFQVFARREVIVSAGVFNTPQLLKLSGIGPRKELQKHGIKVLVNLPGVGENLQDRYEITVNAELKEPLDLYKDCNPLNPPADPCLAAWATGQGFGAQPPFFGPYANNAAYTGRIIQTNPSKLPDIFIIGQATSFQGFVPGFSQIDFVKHWTWLVLKAHTNNTKGTVTLKSANPRLMPDINFNYFAEGGDEDLEAVVQGFKLARGYNNEPQAKQRIAFENYPGPTVDTDAKIRDYIRNESWGHHASCTAKIGAADDPMAVLDSRFRVRGMRGLRVVDACVFPRVPGFFPVAAIMMIGEKAGDVILEDAKCRGRQGADPASEDELLAESSTDSQPKSA